MVMGLLGAYVVIQTLMLMGYAGGKIGETAGKAASRKRFGKYSPHAEVITVRRGRDLMNVRGSEHA